MKKKLTCKTEFGQICVISKGSFCEDMTNEYFADRVRLFPLSSTDKIIKKKSKQDQRKNVQKINSTENV